MASDRNEREENLARDMKRSKAEFVEALKTGDKKRIEKAAEVHGDNHDSYLKARLERKTSEDSEYRRKANTPKTEKIAHFVEREARLLTQQAQARGEKVTFEQMKKEMIKVAERNDQK